MRSTLRPARALIHPIWWIAVALLVANDHVFKGSGLLPAGLTGKLSDFAGLMVAPVLLAVLCRVRTLRGFALSHLAVALGFAGINLSPMMAGWIESLMAPTPFPWAIVVDPTDLIALPMVALSYMLFSSWGTAPAPVARVLGRAGLSVGLLACVATSPPPVEPPPVQPPQPQPGELVFPTEIASLMIANETSTDQLIRVRALDLQVEIDCDDIAQGPSERLSRDWFGPAQVWLLEPDRALPIQKQQRCTVLLVDGAELPTRVIFFRDGAYSENPLSTQATAVPANLRLPVLLPSGTAEWGVHPALFDGPSRVHETVEPICQTVPQGFGIEWTTVPVGERVLAGIATAPDGCTALDFGSNDPQSSLLRWFVCAPLELPFEAGDTLTLRIVGDGVEVIGPGGRILLSRGSIVLADGVERTTTTASNCAPTLDCNLSTPVQVQLHHIEGPPTQPVIGEPTPVGRGMLTLARAERSFVIDRRCTADVQPVGTVILESIFVETF